MAVGEMTQGVAWFVKYNGTTVGPFSYQVLQSMWDRSRIDSSAVISRDRRTWQPIATLGGPFAQQVASAQVELVPSEQHQPPMAGAGQCFVRIGGVVCGPISLAELQAKVSSGFVEANCPVWLAGGANWIPAALVPGLIFPRPRDQVYTWARRYAPAIAGISFGILVLLAVPTWYVFSMMGAREQEAADLRASRRAALEQQKEEIEVRLARAERETQSIRDEAFRLNELRGQTSLQLESVRQQWTLMLVEKIRDNRVQDRMNELERALETLDVQIASMKYEESLHQAELQDLQEEENRILRDIHFELSR